jgi:hypothetical protein
MANAVLKNTSAMLQGKTPEEYMRAKGFISTDDTTNMNLDFYSIENGKIFHYGYKHEDRSSGLPGDRYDLCTYDNVTLDTDICPPPIILQTIQPNKRWQESPQTNSQVQESPQTNTQTSQRPSLIFYDMYSYAIHIVP